MISLIYWANISFPFLNFLGESLLSRSIRLPRRQCSQPVIKVSQGELFEQFHRRNTSECWAGQRVWSEDGGKAVSDGHSVQLKHLVSSCDCQVKLYSNRISTCSKTKISFSLAKVLLKKPKSKGIKWLFSVCLCVLVFFPNIFNKQY